MKLDDLLHQARLVRNYSNPEEVFEAIPVRCLTDEFAPAPSDGVRIIGEITDLFHDAINEHGAQGYGRDNPARYNFTEVVGKLQRDVIASLGANPAGEGGVRARALEEAARVADELPVCCRTIGYETCKYGECGHAVEALGFTEVLAAMRETMESHPHWCKVVGTPAENDLPVRAASMALRLFKGADL